MHAAILFIYFAFDRLAASLGSTRGEAGLVVAAVVLVLLCSFYCGRATSVRRGC